ncbi:GlxA family transcriptional regulator, partial [Pontibacterium sp.]|uniref:GlxA family transcriptional regulator n=1 Tax=Pontibacterium sp. TaxID=2036026 RepID=UPI003563B5CC
MSQHTATINIAIVQYPGAMQSAVEGLRELFGLANRLSTEQGSAAPFNICIQDGWQITETDKTTKLPFQVIILPPCIDGTYYGEEHQTLTRWLKAQHQLGAVLCSVCAGAFILAQTGLLDQRPATTHWVLAERFSEHFPAVHLDANKILINDGDLITAGGLMAWLDLGLELVAQFAHPALMRQLGKQLVVDTGPREQRYYRRFMPRLTHGDSTILQCQHHLQRHFRDSLSVKGMAATC